MPDTDVGFGLSYKEVDASFLEWKYDSTQYGEKTLPDSVAANAEYALCDLFFSVNKKDHMNVAFSDVAVGAEKSWVDSRGQNPDSHINAKTQTRQEVTITMNGDSDGYGQHYGIWWSSQLVPVKARKFYWGNYGMYVCMYLCLKARVGGLF